MPWSLVNSWTYSSAVANVDFTGLAGYSDIRVLCRGVTLGASGVRALRVSTNNGSTFLSTFGDYGEISTTGVETLTGLLQFHPTASAAAGTAEIEINGFDLASPPKTAKQLTRNDTRGVFITTTSALNAVRVFDSSGNNLTGGSIYVYGNLNPWSLVGSWTYSTNVPNVNFTGLAGYTEVRVLIRAITSSVSGQRTLRVSTDNGSTFLATTGDYVFTAGDGAETNDLRMNMHATGTTFARSGQAYIYNFNLTAPKTAQLLVRTDFRTVIIPTTSALNAIQITLALGGNLTGGSIYVYAR